MPAATDDGKPAPSGHFKDALIAHSGDWYPGDGIADLIARIPDGKLYVRQGDGNSRFEISRRTEILFPADAPDPAALSQIVVAACEAGCGSAAAANSAGIEPSDAGTASTSEPPLTPNGSAEAVRGEPSELVGRRASLALPAPRVRNQPALWGMWERGGRWSENGEVRHVGGVAVPRWAACHGRPRSPSTPRRCWPRSRSSAARA